MLLFKSYTIIIVQAVALVCMKQLQLLRFNTFQELH